MTKEDAKQHPLLFSQMLTFWSKCVLECRFTPYKMPFRPLFCGMSAILSIFFAFLFNFILNFAFGLCKEK